MKTNFCNLLKQVILVVFVAMCCLACKQEKTITLTISDLMVIYQNGYLMGSNRILTKGTYSDSVWRADSLAIANSWDK